MSGITNKNIISKNRQNTYEISLPDFAHKEYSSFQEAHDSLLKFLANNSFNKKSGFNLKQHKIAYHGGSMPTGWDEKWSPSTGSSPTMTVAPQFGSRWRGEDGKGNGKPDIPSGDNQINDDSDYKNKSLKQQRPEDYHALYLKNLIKDNIENADIDKDGRSYVAFVEFDDHKEAKEFAKGYANKHKIKVREDNTVEIYCPSFELALEIEKKMPGIVIKTI
jgi:hypothetical protein